MVPLQEQTCVAVTSQLRSVTGKQQMKLEQDIVNFDYEVAN